MYEVWINSKFYALKHSLNGIKAGRDSTDL